MARIGRWFSLPGTINKFRAEYLIRQPDKRWEIKRETTGRAALLQSRGVVPCAPVINCVCMCALSGPGPGNYNYIAGAPHFYYLFIVIAYVNTLAALLFIVRALLIHNGHRSRRVWFLFLIALINLWCRLRLILEHRACNSLIYELGVFFL
jgi:hypothetical protein